MAHGGVGGRLLRVPYAGICVNALFLHGDPMEVGSTGGGAHRFRRNSRGGLVVWPLQLYFCVSGLLQGHSRGGGKGEGDQ